VKSAKVSPNVVFGWRNVILPLCGASERGELGGAGRGCFSLACTTRKSF